MACLRRCGVTEIFQLAFPSVLQAARKFPQSSPRACGSVGIARRPRAWVLELPCGDEMTWLGGGGRIAHRQAKARRLRPAGLCSERNLTPFVSGFSGGRVKQHPIANPNRHGGEAFGVRTTWGWVQ